MSQIHRIDLSKEELQQAVNNLIEENKQLQMKLGKIEQIVNDWNNDASHSFEDMCKINVILKE